LAQAAEYAANYCIIWIAPEITEKEYPKRFSALYRPAYCRPGPPTDVTTMSLSDVYYLLSDYSLDKILLASAALGVTLILKKTLLKKKLKRLSAIMPFVAGTVFNMIFSLFCEKNGTFGQILKDGLSTGSAATVIYAVVTGFITEQPEYESVPLDSLLLEGLLAGYVSPEDLPATAAAIAEILREDLSKEEERQRLTDALNAFPSITPIEAEMLVKIIQNVLTAAE